MSNTGQSMTQAITTAELLPRERAFAEKVREVYDQYKTGIIIPCHPACHFTKSLRSENLVGKPRTHFILLPSFSGIKEAGTGVMVRWPWHNRKILSNPLTVWDRSGKNELGAIHFQLNRENRDEVARALVEGLFTAFAAEMDQQLPGFQASLNKIAEMVKATRDWQGGRALYYHYEQMLLAPDNPEPEMVTAGDG